MPNCDLDALFVRTATSNGKAKETYYDNTITGFVCEVRNTGGKTYALRYTDSHGKQRQYTIGAAKDISFAQARAQAEKLRSRIVLGEDIDQEKATKRLTPTLEEFSRDRLLPYLKGYKKAWKADEAHLRHHLLPLFGKQHLDQIQSEDIVSHLHSMKSAGYSPAHSNRSVTLLRFIYNRARQWKIPGSEQDPTRGIKLLTVNNARERFLTAEETQRLIDVLNHSENTQLKYIVPLLLLLACRKRELLDAQWQDFDMDRRLWRIPMTKNGRPRHVPLSAKAIEILNQLPRWPGCPYVVPNPLSLKPFVTIYKTWNTARKEAGMPELRMHDLRHSAASFLVNSNHSLYVVQKILGHSQIKTTARYSHLAPETLLNAADAMASAAGMEVVPVVTAPAPTEPVPAMSSSTTPNPGLRLVGKSETPAGEMEKAA